jgi:flagellar protein FliO/FliZ
MRFRSLLTRGAAMAGALTLLPAQVAHAAGGTGENTPLHLPTTAVHHVSTSGGSGIVRTIVALVIVIGVIYAVARILKAVKTRDQKATGDGLSHLASLPLGPNKSVALVRSGADIVLVGIAENGVTPIKTYTEQEAIANGLLPPERDALDPARREHSFEGFVESLRRMTARA